MSAPKERSILLSDDEVRGFLDREKTVIRRLVTVPWKGHRRVLPYDPYWSDEDGRLVFSDDYGDWHDAETTTIGPFGEPDDRLWMRERALLTPSNYAGATYDATTRTSTNIGSVTDPTGDRRVVLYEADTSRDDIAEALGHGARWTGAAWLPRWAARPARLDVVSIRIERLHAITEEDAIAEGVVPFFTRFTGIGREQTLTTGERCVDAEHRASFAVSWDERFGDRVLWKANPWIWRAEVRLVAVEARR